MPKTRSILQPECTRATKRCFHTGRTDNLQIHHIYFGNPNRKISDENGFWVWLTAEYHNQNSRVDVHHDAEFDLELKRLCQAKYEETHGRDEFIRLIGRSYL
jgi:hypothetical protein